MSKCLTDDQRRRVRLLSEKLKTMEGFVAMHKWTDYDSYRAARSKFLTGFLPDAMANPCGTACCLAGKAGLMPEFQAEGFSWHHDQDGNYFTTSVADFFGAATASAVFTGAWCKANIQTPQQGALVLEHFLENEERAAEAGNEWIPSAAIRDQVEAMAPASGIGWAARFPVSLKWAYRGVDPFAPASS